MKRSVRAWILLAACLVFARAQAAPSPAPRETAKYGVYLLTSRIGSMVSRTLDVVHQGRPAVRMEADLDASIVALGSTVKTAFSMSHLLDTGGRPIQSRMVINSMGRTTTILADYHPDRVVCDVTAGGQKSSKVVPIPQGVTLTGDPQLSGFTPDAELKPGRKTVLHFFEPMTLSIQKVETEVLKFEKRTVGGKQIPAFLIRASNSITGTSESWVDEKGRLLEDDSKIGLRLVREDVPLTASARGYVPPSDFAVATSIKTEVRLPDARKTRSLRLRVSGIPEAGLVLSDARQRVVEQRKEGESVTAVYLVEARPLPEAGLALAQPGAPGLEDAPYLEVSDPAVREQARKLRGTDSDRAALARRIRAWVKQHMQKPSNIGTPRGAAEILRSRDGVCRDYATLFTGVARAAGLPTRLCSGLVYFRDAFYYHAWVECQLTDGADGWFALDPTLEDDFVDATHLKFSQGIPTDTFAALRVVGEIRAEILEYR